MTFTLVLSAARERYPKLLCRQLYSLNSNAIGVKGAIAIAEMLKYNETLTSLK